MTASSIIAEFPATTPLPAWAVPATPRAAKAAGPEVSAFHAGASLLALDRILHAEPPWLGTLRMRQALAAAAASAHLLGHHEDAYALRDAEHLSGSGADPGPAGRLHRTWRWLAGRSPRHDDATMARLCAGLGRPAVAFPPLMPAEAAGTPIATAAAVAACVVMARGDLPADEALILALMLADLALARALRWPVSVPLLATAINHPSLKGGGRRAAPGETGWEAVCYAGYAQAAAEAHQSAIELTSRYERLRRVAGQVRTRNRDDAVGRLLADDVVAPASLSGLGSDRAARRFCDRLVLLGGIRELSGRAAFRLYGL